MIAYHPDMPVPVFAHRGVSYDDSAQLGRSLVPVVDRAVRAGDAVVLALDAAAMSALGASVDLTRVDLLEIDRPVRQDAFQLAARRATAATAAARDGIASLLVTQPLPSLGMPDSYWLRLEAALDAALVHLPVTLLCAYRTALAAYRTCHPQVGPLAAPHDNPAYQAPPDVVRNLPGVVVPPPPAHATAWHFTSSGLTSLRRALTERVVAAGLDHEAGEDLVYSASEIATNAVEHGSGAGTLWAWVDGDEVVCLVADRGRLADPFPGVVPPSPDQGRGRGLWLARALCDEVDVESGPSGTRVRLVRRLVRSEPMSRQIR